ncbi:pentapeptide repeat-containing protein [Micromonospora chalcea]
MTIVEILATFIRESARVTKGNTCGGVSVSADVQAALTVLGRRPRRPEPERLDFSGTCLRGADLKGLNFQGSSFAGACLEDADLFSARLQSTTLTGACLKRTDLSNANLQWAHMAGINLQRAILFAAQLQGAILTRAKMQEASCLGADLQRTNLLQARLDGANLNSANLSEAGLVAAQLQASRLVGARLCGATLRGAVLDRADLTSADFQGANLTNCSMRRAMIRNTSFENADIGYEQFNQVNPRIWSGRQHQSTRATNEDDRTQRWARLTEQQLRREQNFVTAARSGLRELVFTIEDLDDAGIWPRDEDGRALSDLALQIAAWADSLPDAGFATEWIPALTPLIDQWWPSYPREVEELDRHVQEIRRVMNFYLIVQTARGFTAPAGEEDPDGSNAAPPSEGDQPKRGSDAFAE